MAEKIKIATPVGELQYVNIAGQGKQNYNEDGFEYVASVTLEGQDSLDLKAKFDELYDEEHVKGKVFKSKPYRILMHPEMKDGEVVRDEDDKVIYTDKPTGKIMFASKTIATWPDGKANKIIVKNGKGAQVEIGDRKIGNGSLGAISGKAAYYINGKEDGVSFYLNAVQLTKFVEYVEDDGFEVVEGDDTFTGFDEELPEVTTEPEAQTARPKL